MKGEEEAKVKELIEACARGKTEEVARLLQSPSLLIKGSLTTTGRSPLLAACSQPNPEPVSLLLAFPDLDLNLPDFKGDYPFIVALLSGFHEIVRLLLADPRLNVSPFHRACGLGKEREVLHLLSDPSIDPNEPAFRQISPLVLSCLLGELEIVKILLADERVDVNDAFNMICYHQLVEQAKWLIFHPQFKVNGKEEGDPLRSPLWTGLVSCQKEIIEAILASSSHVETQAPCMWTLSAAEEARQWDLDAIADLIEAYELSPTETQMTLRRSFGHDGFSFFSPPSSSSFLLLPPPPSLSSCLCLNLFLGIEDIFALLLLLSDGYLRLSQDVQTEREKRAKRFFQITKNLPQELQMILVRRVYLSHEYFFLSSQTESALKRILSFPFR